MAKEFDFNETAIKMAVALLAFKKAKKANSTLNMAKYFEDKLDQVSNTWLYADVCESGSFHYKEFVDGSQLQRLQKSNGDTVYRYLG
ncbi:MAG: hypothetical protein BWY78_00080 [Alphaproteobacteria bacterium ADurb.Bin438]|nr:MAG: hypothetical protein BWY78_00080 [Alphaproteobacteria bacterium ADurb.Bin438]